ncbi:MAG: hypothetical protein IT373_09495 [Polyangiaceae bacterium]|nr:hypothetical protein [Polyangiaceae bacterium]
MKIQTLALVTLAAATSLPACAGGAKGEGTSVAGDGGSGAATSTVLCIPNEQRACACPGGVDGVQVCLEDGSGLGACECGPGNTGTGGSSFVGCGDGTCSADEDCHSCAGDCGVCEPCVVAPACDNAMIPDPSLPHVGTLDVPAMTELGAEQILARLGERVAEAGTAVRVLAAALDDEVRPDEHPLVAKLREALASHPEAASAVRRQLARAGMSSPSSYRNLHPEAYAVPQKTAMDVVPPGGTVACGAPMLRIGVASITVHEEDDDWANDIVYCTIQAETAAGAEIRVTPQTPNLDEGDSYQYSLEAGVFWGQQGPTSPEGNIQLTYDCIEADTSDGYQNLINSIGEAAGQIGDVWVGDYGWVFTTVGAIAPVVADALALDGDDHLFNAQQIIPLAMQLELTNGAWWSVRRQGTHSLSDWDWELFVKAWGCAEYGTL